MKPFIFFILTLGVFNLSSQDSLSSKRGTIRVVKTTESIVEVDSLDIDSVSKLTENDHEAFFKGGKAKMQVYFFQNMKYPDIAKRERVSGEVWVKFVVDEFGNIGFVQPKSYSNAVFVNEAIRLIEEMPKWVPAVKNGNPLASEVDLKVEFFVPLMDED